MFRLSCGCTYRKTACAGYTKGTSKRQWCSTELHNKTSLQSNSSELALPPPNELGDLVRSASRSTANHNKTSLQNNSSELARPPPVDSATCWWDQLQNPCHLSCRRSPLQTHSWGGKATRANLDHSAVPNPPPRACSHLVWKRGQRCNW